MIKVAENIVIKSIDNDSLLAVQSKGDYDYRETMAIENDGKTNFCVATDKFLPILEEGISKITQEMASVIIHTLDTEYRLPVLRERGVFLAKPEVTIPEGEPLKCWSYNFSDKSLNSNTNSNSVSLASMLVVIGSDVLARNVTNVLEVYGDSSTSVACISPEEYSLIQKLGNCSMSYYSSGVLSAKSSKGEVRVRKAKDKIDIAALEKNLSVGQEHFNVDLSSAKLKTMSKFVLEKVLVTFKTGSVTFLTESAKKTFEAPGLTLSSAVSIEVMSKDLKYLTGEVSLKSFNSSGKERYILKVNEKDKTVYIMVKPYKGEMTW